MKRCDIPSNTYNGAISSIDVDPKIITYRRDGLDEQLQFEWNCKGGTFEDVNGNGKAIVDKGKSANNEDDLVTIRVFPDDRGKEFECVTDNMFWFYNGKYDGDDNGIDTKCRAKNDDLSEILDRYGVKP